MEVEKTIEENSIEVENYIEDFLKNKSLSSAIFITEEYLKGHIIIGGRQNVNKQAIRVILQALRNSIPKEKVKENIKILKQTPRKEFCNYDDYTFGSIRALERLLEE